MTRNRWHRNLGRVLVTDACVAMQATNPDPSSTYVEHDGELKEVTAALLTDEEPEPEPCHYCGSGDRVPQEQWICPACDAEWPPTPTGPE